MDTMQDELEAAYPALRIQLLGINEKGQEAGNSATTEGRDLPWLQDVDEDQNGLGDVAKDLWNITFRDVVILDGQNVPVAVFNLNQRNLGEQEDYDALREILVDVAMTSQLPWTNPDNSLDVDASGAVVPLDVLLVVNRLNEMGNHKLAPPTTAELSPPFYDCSGDGNLTAVDPLQIINFLNDYSQSPEGESSLPADFVDQGVFVRELAGLQLGEDQLAVNGQLETAPGGRLQLHTGDFLLEPAEYLLRQTDGARLVVSSRAVTQMDFHPFESSRESQGSVSHGSEPENSNWSDELDIAQLE